MLKSLYCYWSTQHCKWNPLMAAWNHHGTQSGPIRSNFVSNGWLWTRWQEHWLYTHLILHSAFAFALRDSRSRAASVWKKLHKLHRTNESQKDKRVQLKGSSGREQNRNKKEHTRKDYNHNTKGESKKRKAKRVCVGKTLVEKPRKEKKKQEQTSKVQGMQKGKDQHGQTNSVQACKRSYILPSCNRPYHFHMLGFHHTCKKAFFYFLFFWCRSNTKGCKTRKGPTMQTEN